MPIFLERDTSPIPRLQCHCRTSLAKRVEHFQPLCRCGKRGGCVFVELEDECTRRLCHDAAEGHDLPLTRLAQAVVSDMIVRRDEALHSGLADRSSKAPFSPRAAAASPQPPLGDRGPRAREALRTPGAGATMNALRIAIVTGSTRPSSPGPPR